jgi:DnaJ-class molecular chaperone
VSGGEDSAERRAARTEDRATPSEDRATPSEDRATPSEDRAACTPCRGTGKVTSALGGEQHEVSCPWCGGTGRFQPGRDAQESPAERDPGNER